MRRSFLLLVTVASVVLLVCGAAWAAAGDLDPTFDGDGVVARTEPGFDSYYGSTVNDLAVLPDTGKIVAFDSYVGILARYNPDGSLDDTFGGDDGMVHMGDRGDDDPEGFFPDAFVVQPDGGLVVGGRVRALNSEPQFALTRFLPDGTLDTAFGGGDGMVAIGFGGHATEEVNALAMQGDNIVAAGYMKFPRRDTDVAVARFLPDGTPDPSFGGGDGKQISDVRGYDFVDDLAALPDGGLMFAGVSDGLSDSVYEYDVSLVRFRPDGTPDKSFGGGDGEVVTGYARGTNDGASSLVLRGSRAVVAGSTSAAKKDSPSRFALFAYAEDGSLAKSFGGGDGKVKTVFGLGDAYANDVAVQADDKLLVVGSRDKSLKGYRDRNFALARYNPDGTLDGSFGGGDGKLTTDVSPGTEDYAAAVDIDGDGRAVVGGGARVPDSDSYTGESSVFALARYLLE